MNSIDEVLIKMDEIVEECKSQNSRIGYFAILYRQVTRRIKQGILDLEFDDNPRMEKLDILFAGRFIDAYESWKSGQKPTKSWIEAFEASTSGKHLVLQHLFLGINAHINLDLGISAVETMGTQPIQGIQNDFNKINSVLAELVDGVKTNISKVSPVFGLLIPLAKGRDEMLLNFSIELAREGAWKYAGEYYETSNRKLLIEDRDNKISSLAKKLINPGKLLSFIIKLVGFAEWKSVSNTMDQLDTVAQKVL